MKTHIGFGLEQIFSDRGDLFYCYFYSGWNLEQIDTSFVRGDNIIHAFRIADNARKAMYKNQNSWVLVSRRKLKNYQNAAGKRTVMRIYQEGADGTVTVDEVYG